MERRTFLIAAGGMLVASTAGAVAKQIGVSPPSSAGVLHDLMARIEKTSDGRLGVALHDTGTGRRFSYRGDEHFAMLSTFKLILAGATLVRVEQGRERLDRRLTVQQSDVQGWSPFAARRAGGTATVGELCRGMTVESDNGAANLLLAALGGPAALTQFLHQIGDTTTAMARDKTVERPWLGAALAQTTPLAMRDNAEHLWLGSVLTPAHRAQLVDWAVASRTGRGRLRAGIPARWRAGNKTGTGEGGSSNDLAVFWPANRRPVVVASYLTGTALDTEAANAIHAQVARAVVSAI